MVQRAELASKGIATTVSLLHTDAIPKKKKGSCLPAGEASRVLLGPQHEGGPDWTHHPQACVHTVRNSEPWLPSLPKHHV